MTIKKLYLSVSIVALSVVTTLIFKSQAVQAAAKEETKVLVCKSPNAARFHLDKDCIGLNKCKREIVTVTKAEAEDEGLTCCGFCCKKK